MNSLETLWLNGTAITDAGVCTLPPSSGVLFVRLADTRVSNVGLACLAKLPTLIELDLSGTDVDASGLPVLADHFHLGHLYLSRTKVRRSEAAQLLPRLRIQADE